MAIRVLALVLGVLLVAGPIGVYVFDLLPPSAPDDAPQVLGIVALAGGWMAIMAASGGE